MNDNQNAFVKRSTSRVLAEPGGKSSMGFLFGPKNVTATPAKAKGKENAVNAAPATASPKESAIEAAARIKLKNEAQHFSMLGCAAKSTERTSRNAFASASATNSYNVLTDRSTSRVVSSRADWSFRICFRVF